MFCHPDDVYTKMLLMALYSKNNTFHLWIKQLWVNQGTNFKLQNLLQIINWNLCPNVYSHTLCNTQEQFNSIYVTKKRLLVSVCPNITLCTMPSLCKIWNYLLPTNKLEGSHWSGYCGLYPNMFWHIRIKSTISWPMGAFQSSNAVTH